MNWPGGQISGPESLIDGKGRNIFFGWVMEARDRALDHGWASVMSLPRVMSITNDGLLGIAPAPELEALRLNRH